MRLFKVTACIPSPEKVRTQRELQNTFFTKWVPYDSWFAEQQRIQKQGGRIIKAAPLLLNPLLLSEPAVVGDPLGKKGVLQFSLRPHLFRAGDAGGDFELSLIHI